MTTRRTSITWGGIRTLLVIALAGSLLGNVVADGADDRLGGGFSTAPANSKELSVSARFFLDPDRWTGKLAVTAKMAPRWHVYSITQPAGGPARTVIRLHASQAIQLTGPFRPDRAPMTRQYEFFSVPSEEHHDEVTWTAPIRLVNHIDVERLTISGELEGQICQKGGACVPLDAIDSSFIAAFAGQTVETVAPLDPAHGASGFGFRGDNAHVVLTGQAWPSVVRPGEKVTLELRAVTDPGWHVYAAAETAEELAASNVTVIGVAKPKGWALTKPRPSVRPRQVPSTASRGPAVGYHEGEVRWSSELIVPRDAPHGKYRLTGHIGFQTCSRGACDAPDAAQFVADLAVGPQPLEGTLALELRPSTYQAAVQLARTAVFDETRPPVRVLDGSTAAAHIALGFLGGLLLNLMPCVLPVIGLKVLSFVEQSRHNRWRAWELNLAYSLGLLCVFLGLATLAAFFNLSWGEQFTLTWFKVSMTILVFAMALSFLGVWEIPIPGFAGRGWSAEWAAREGPHGAFFKGAFTTILATPCSGPFLGPVFAYTLEQPPYMTYAIFTSIGLGMAFPYLVIGAVPKLVRFLPQPGPWMETTKQLMGFVLLATVVYFYSTLNTEHVVPTLALMMGVWLACWWIGRTPVTAEPFKKITAWAGGIAVAVAVGLAAFRVASPSDNRITWQTFSPHAVAQAQAERKTVMVDFTADWCWNCKYNLKYAINTEEVADLVDRFEVVPLLADWTDRSDDIKGMLDHLGGRSIPLLAIYPADNPREVIVLRDLLSEDKVLAALKQAGPSATAGGESPRAAMKSP